MSMPSGQIAWVYTEAPADMAGFDGGALIKVADGARPFSAGGFPYRSNFEAWRKRFPGLPLGAWSFIYRGSDPQASAEALTWARADYYCLDVEDWQGATVTGQSITKVVAAIRKLDPGKPVGFSTYATRAQAMEHKVPWDTCLRECDFSSPQVYEPYQVPQYAQAVREGKGKTLVSLSPASSPAGWHDVAKAELARTGTVLYWRLGTLRPAVRTAITSLQEETMPTAVEIADAVIHRLNEEGTGAGQRSFGGTVQATLRNTQSLYNMTAGLMDDEAKFTALAEKILVALQADPSDRIDEDALGQRVAEILHTLGLSVTIADADLQRNLSEVLERSRIDVTPATG